MTKYLHQRKNFKAISSIRQRQCDGQPCLKSKHQAFSILHFNWNSYVQRISIEILFLICLFVSFTLIVWRLTILLLFFVFQKCDLILLSLIFLLCIADRIAGNRLLSGFEVALRLLDCGNDFIVEMFFCVIFVVCFFTAVYVSQ